MKAKDRTRGIVAVAAACAGIALFGTPTIPADSVRMTQNSMRTVTVTYVLGDENNQEPAIVTVDFETNVTGTAEGPWASIGTRNFRGVAGDVNKVVAPGTNRITWAAYKDWPDRHVTNGNFRARVKAWAKTCPPDYMVIDLSVSGSRSYYLDEDALPLGIEDDYYRKDALVMRKIPAAGVKWRMGSPGTEKGRYASLEGTHYVTLSDDYYMGVFPVTRWQYARIMGTSVASIAADRQCQVMTRLSWNKIRYNNDNTTTGLNGGTWPVDRTVRTDSPIGMLRTKTGIESFDLPTMAQWEFACRAGTSSALYTGHELSVSDPSLSVSDPELDEIAWYCGNTADCPPRVGVKKPNGWGLYDMYGSTYEWCLDWYHTSWQENEDDPVGPDSTTETPLQRYLGSSAYNCQPKYCRSAYRNHIPPSNAYSQYDILGFRVKCLAVAP